MGYADLSCYGQKQVETPHLDRLASEGIRFTQFYVGSPICSPSRTAFTTGQYPARWRITSYLASRAENERRGMAQWLDPKAPTLARALQQAGYATGHFGKWHMGGQRDVGEAPLITEYGFDESLTQFEGLGDRILPLLDAFDGNLPSEILPGQRRPRAWQDRMDGPVEGDRRIRRPGAAVHSSRPSKRAGPSTSMCGPMMFTRRSSRPRRCGGTAARRSFTSGWSRRLDEQLAPLFDYIRQRPSLRTNTLIIVASDNGPEPGAGSAGLFRGHKGMLYEGGIREPFIVWGPGLMEKSACGTLNETTVVSAVDLFPIHAHIWREPPCPPELTFDGEDLSRAFLGKSVGPTVQSLVLEPAARPAGKQWERPCPTWPCARETGSCCWGGMAATRNFTTWRRTREKRITWPRSIRRSSRA